MISNIRPDNFENPLDVVGCFVKVNDEYLLLKRQDHDSAPNKWGLPAGGVLKTETLVESMLRELFEETGIKATEKDLTYFDKVYADGAGGRRIVFYMYKMSLEEKPEVILDPEEHKDYIWIKAENISEVDYIYGLDYSFDMLLKK